MLKPPLKGTPHTSVVIHWPGLEGVGRTWTDGTQHWTRSHRSLSQLQGKNMTWFSRPWTQGREVCQHFSGLGLWKPWRDWEMCYDYKSNYFEWEMHRDFQDCWPASGSLVYAWWWRKIWETLFTFLRKSWKRQVPFLTLEETLSQRHHEPASQTHRKTKMLEIIVSVRRGLVHEITAHNINKAKNLTWLMCKKTKKHPQPLRNKER